MLLHAVMPLAYSDADGNLVPDPTLWPSGMQTTVDYVHSKGLGFGLYGDRGTDYTMLAGRPIARSPYRELQGMT
jgi:hypothetical protein